MKASDWLGRRVGFKDREGQVIEADDRTGRVFVQLDSPLGEPSPVVPVTAIELELLEILEE